MIAQLRKIQASWALTPKELSEISHTPLDVMTKYLDLSLQDFDSLPTVPPGMENAMPLISVFTSLQKLRPNEEDQHEWLRQPNAILENQIPFQVMMMSPSHLSWVSYTLDSAVRQQNL